MLTLDQTTRATHPPQRRSRHLAWLAGLVLVAATVLAYQPAWHAGFIWDDNDYVTENPLLTAPDGLKRIWFSTDSPSQYFPLVYTVFRIEYSLWGLNAAGYHWVNILLHAVNALLVWRVLGRLRLPGAWLAAGLFALHPVNVESVAWITQLKNVLSLFFALLTVLAWLEFLDRKTRWPWYGLALAFFALALFSKTTTCTLPAALLLILWLKKEPIRWARLGQLAPFVALGVAMGFVSMWWERHHQGTEGAVYAMSLAERLLVAGRAVWFYAGKLVWPANLAFNYPLWKIQPADPLGYGWLLAGAALAAIIGCARRFLGRGPEVAALYYVATLSPLLGFIMLYTFRYTFVADHYQYIAMIGPAALAAAALSTFGTRNTKHEAHAGKGTVVPDRSCEVRPLPSFRISSFGFRVSTLIGVLLLATLGALTWRQCGMYADLETLWRTTVERNPRSFMAYNNLGTVFLRRQQWDDAMLCFRQALEIQPDSPNAHFNVAQLLLAQGRLDEAAAHLRSVLQVQPRDAKAHCDLSQILLREGRLDEALAHARSAVEYEPEFAEGHNHLGWVLLQTGQPEEAILHCRNAVILRPAFADAHYNLGNACIQTGRVDDAMRHYQKVLELQPGNADVHNNLGWILLQTGRLDDAMGHFQSALSNQPAFAMAHGNLAIAFARKGQPREAVAHYREVLRLQPDTLPVLAELAWLLATWPDASIRNGAEAAALAERASRLCGQEEPMILRAVAAAHAENGRYTEAATVARRILDLPGTRSNPALAEAIRSQIRAYEAGTPFRQTADTAQAHSPVKP